MEINTTIGIKDQYLQEWFIELSKLTNKENVLRAMKEEIIFMEDLLKKTIQK